MPLHTIIAWVLYPPSSGPYSPAIQRSTQRSKSCSALYPLWDKVSCPYRYRTPQRSLNRTIRLQWPAYIRQAIRALEQSGQKSMRRHVLTRFKRLHPAYRRSNPLPGSRNPHCNGPQDCCTPHPFMTPSNPQTLEPVLHHIGTPCAFAQDSVLLRGTNRPKTGDNK